MSPRMTIAAMLAELRTFADPETPPAKGAFGAAPEPKSTRTGHGRDPRPWTPREQAAIDGWLKDNVRNGRLLEPPKGRAFRPFLMIRALKGDNGARPLAAGVRPTMTPDVWTSMGAPQPGATFAWSPSKLITTDAPVGLHAHVWNLGLAPCIGARVEFWQADHQPTSTPQKLIAVTYVDLPGRYSTSCHTIVTCPVAYQPDAATVASAQGLISIVVRVSAFNDRPQSGVWDPSVERHVARAVCKAEPSNF